MSAYPRPPVTPETRTLRTVRSHLQEAEDELVTALEWAGHPSFQRENAALALKHAKAAVRELEAMQARVKIEEEMTGYLAGEKVA